MYVMIPIPVTETFRMCSNGVGNETLLSMEVARALMQALSNPNSADIAFHHFLLASMYRLLRGPRAKIVYYWESFNVAHSCQPRALKHYARFAWP